MHDSKIFIVTTYPGVASEQIQNVAKSIEGAKLHHIPCVGVYQLEVPDSQVKMAQTRFAQCHPIIQRVE